MRLLLFIILVGFNLFYFEAISQNLSNPINPADLEKPSYLGATIGFGQNFQTGSLFVECPNCEFLDGNKFNFTIGLYYEKTVFSGVLLGMDALFSTGGLSSSYLENETVEVIDPTSDFRDNVVIPFRHTADLSLQDISFVPYVKLEPFKFIFLKFGLSYNMNISSNLTHTKELLKREVTLSNGVVSSVKLADSKTNIITIQDGEFKELEKSYLAINPSIGFNIPFDAKRKIVFSPWFTYSLPLSNMATNSKDFKVNKWLLMLSIGFKL